MTPYRKVPDHFKEEVSRVLKASKVKYDYRAHFLSAKTNTGIDVSFNPVHKWYVTYNVPTGVVDLNGFKETYQVYATGQTLLHAITTLRQKIDTSYDLAMAQLNPLIDGEATEEE